MSTMSKKRISTRELTMTALFVTLITVGAFIRIPLPNCPFTLQILFTTLAGIILGSRLGASALEFILYSVLLVCLYSPLAVVLAISCNLLLGILWALWLVPMW